MSLARLSVLDRHGGGGGASMISHNEIQSEV